MKNATFYILPALNEEASVAAVISGLKEVDPNGVVVVVDDASTDSTILRAASQGACVLPLVDQLGAWGAMQAGLRYAAEKGCERVVTLDADGQHPPAEVPKLLSAIDQTGANVVIGACGLRGSRLRRFAWRMMRGVSGISAEDLTSGFRLYDRQAVDILVSERASYLEQQDVGVLALLLRNNLKVVEVEVSMSPRAVGTSRIFSSWAKVCWYMLQTLLLSASKRGVQTVKLAKHQGAFIHD